MKYKKDKHVENLINNLGGWWFIMFLGILGLIAGIILSQWK
jgi:uncharacterized membrane protein HdeD (DUF308 family)